MLTFDLHGADINQAYKSFLGIWAQDGNYTMVGPNVQRPIYRKLDNPNLYLASVEVDALKLMQASVFLSPI